MRYSNVNESFFDFLKNRKKKETDNVISRIQNFLDMNPQFGYDSKHLLPGLCPIKKMAESIVVSEKYLKSFINSINYETIKTFRINSKIWNGDLVVLMPSKKSNDPKFAKSYNPSIESFYDYLVDLESYPKRKRRYSSRSYYYDRYGNRRYKRHVSESFFSDFMSWLKGDDVDSEEINYDNAIFQVTHFLVKYPGYDYDKQSDTPGFIFLTTLADAIQIPYESLVKLFKNNKFENAEITNFKLETIDGPIVIFGKPSVDRKEQWDSWNAELKAKSEDQIQDIADASVEVEKEIEQEQKTEDISPESKESPEEIKPIVTTLRKDVIEKIANLTTDAFLNVIIKKAKKESSSVKQNIILSRFDSMEEEDKKKLVYNFIEDLLTNKLDYLKSSEISSKIFQDKSGENVLKSNIGVETTSVILSNFIWSDPSAIQELINFYKSSYSISPEEKIELESDITKQDELKKSTESKSEPSKVENIVQTVNFSKKVLEKLKNKVLGKEIKGMSEILKSSSNDDNVITTIKTIILNFSKFPKTEMEKLLGSVINEYKNNPGNFYISSDIELASDVFSDYLINENPSLFSTFFKKISGE